ncbi:MAG: FtsQ-type POTRA domain-containing protein [Cyanomargarita calcarea GSE-NOS-MK-12-04C]|jgi:cell division protein FtsQ|uniref:FtsQ-type POTRA domain-containing protein n=1 Tax=Cyanomargarita calcarea GSE-NOS-MK-12-04C TaxID=2839659 RepID=A0A951URP2_9CYAN|nr:FtsQ-type POTRA domain-containing protein [Cyanomargarita calcarea GSE-NOS-MK-12-04C]
MADMASVSRTDLEGRRKKLRKKRQTKIIQAIWRTIAVSGLAGGLLWVAIQPIWILKDPQQIEISQIRSSLLPDESIRSLLALSYPQSLLRIDPSALAQSLEKQPIIAQATVTRRLFPPGLIIQIQERVPVALAQSGNTKSTVGLLDVTGVWMPLEKYRSLNPQFLLPSLKVIGDPEQYRPYWTQIYQAVSQSSVKVMEINCQDPTNIVLKTELGKVHLGAPSSQISDQIKVIAQMRHLPAKLNSSQIEYIDLKNPDRPIVQMNQNNSRNSKSP